MTEIQCNKPDRPLIVFRRLPPAL